MRIRPLKKKLGRCYLLLVGRVYCLDLATLAPELLEFMGTKIVVPGQDSKDVQTQAVQGLTEGLAPEPSK